MNLANHLLVDGFGDKYDAAIVVTNDSDLKNPMRVVKNELKKEMWTGQPGSKADAASGPQAGHHAPATDSVWCGGRIAVSRYDL